MQLLFRIRSVVGHGIRCPNFRDFSRVRVHLHAVERPRVIGARERRDVVSAREIRHKRVLNGFSSTVEPASGEQHRRVRVAFGQIIIPKIRASVDNCRIGLFQIPVNRLPDIVSSGFEIRIRIVPGIERLRIDVFSSGAVFCLDALLPPVHHVRGDCRPATVAELKGVRPAAFSRNALRPVFDKLRARGNAEQQRRRCRKCKSYEAGGGGEIVFIFGQIVHFAHKK